MPLQLIASFLLKEIFDHAEIAYCWPLLAEGAVLEGVRSFTRYQMEVAVIRSLLRLRTDIDARRAQAVEHGLCPANVFEALPTDLEYLQESLIEGTAKLIFGGINIVSYLLIMSLLIGNAALVAAVVCLLMGVVIGEIYRFLFRALRVHRDQSSMLNRAYRLGCIPRELPDFMINNRVMKNGRMSRFKAVYELLDQDVAAQEKMAAWASLIEFIIHWGSTAILVAVFLLAGVLKTSPTSIGRSVVLVVLLERCGDALVDLVKGGIWLQRGHVGMGRSIHELINLPQAPAASETGFPTGDILRVKKLAYEREDRAVFRNIWFTARPGQVTILIGPRGSGKTPLLFTLQGLYQPSSGQIFLGRKKVANQSLRRRLVHLVLDHMLICWQVDTLFDLFQAVQPDEEAENEKAMWLALEKVGVKEEVTRLPEGLRNLLVDPLTGRKNLSECDLRLVSIARALLKNPLVVLLDEPLRRSQGRQRVWQTIKLLAKEEKIVVLSVENLEDLDGLDLNGVDINKVYMKSSLP